MKNKKTKTDLQKYILAILEDSPDGMTWKDLQPKLYEKYDIRRHHGSISGCLSTMHKALDVFYINMKRDNCYPYVHAKYRSKYLDSQRTDFPKRANKWKDVADLLYFVMTAENIPAKAWDNALEEYRKLSNE